MDAGGGGPLEGNNRISSASASTEDEWSELENAIRGTMLRAPPLKIVGHAADPNDCEEWGDDFVFDEDSKSSLGSSGEAVPASASGDIPGKAIPLHQPSSSMEDGAATLSHRQSWSSGGPAGGGGFLKLHKQRAVPPPLGASQSNKANSLSRRISIRRSHFRSSLALPTPSEEQLAVLNEFMEFAIFLPEVPEQDFQQLMDSPAPLLDEEDALEDGNLSVDISKLEKAVADAKSAGDAQRELRSLIELALVFREKQLDAECFQRLEQAYGAIMAHRDALPTDEIVFLQSECLAHMGESLIRLKNFTAAAEMLDKAIECLSSGTKKLSGVEAHIEVLLGLCAVETNSFRAAADHFLKSLRLATSVGIGLRSGETAVFYPRPFAQACMHVSQMCLDSGDVMQSLTYLRPAIFYASRADDAVLKRESIFVYQTAKTFAGTQHRQHHRGSVDSAGLPKRRSGNSEASDLVSSGILSEEKSADTSSARRLSSGGSSQGSKRGGVTIRTPPPDSKGGTTNVTGVAHPESSSDDWGSNSSSDEDWDFEIAMEEEEQQRNGRALTSSDTRSSTDSRLNPTLAMLRSMMRDSEAQSATAEEELFPSRYRFFNPDAFDQQASIQLIRLHKPSMMVSQLTRQGRKMMSEEELESWLGSLISQSSGITKSGQDAKARTLQQLQAQLQYLDKFSDEWTEKFLQFTSAALREGNLQALQDVAFEFFSLVPSAKRTVLDEDDYRFLNGFFRRCLEILRNVCRNWKPELFSSFDGVSQILEDLFPDHRSSVKVLHAQLLAHNFLKTAGQESIQCIIFEDLCSVLQENFQSLRSLTAGGSGRPSSFRFTGSMERGLDLDPQSPISGDELCAEVLCTAHLFMSGRSPFSCDVLPQESMGSQYFLETPVLDLRPATTMFQRSYSSVAPFLADPSARIHAIWELFCRMPHLTEAKAKCALILGMHAKEQDASPLAESLLFEALYIVSQVPHSVRGEPFVFSELCGIVLQEYADTLLANEKFKYAVVAFDSCLQHYSTTHGAKKNHDLLRRLAVVCHENGDMKRAMAFYYDVLQRAREDKNTNEVVYVSEILADMWMDKADLKSAETLIVHAIDCLDEHQPGLVSRVDVNYLRLQMKLAKILLAGYYFERAIDLLEDLQDMDLPHGKEVDVHLLLAKGYLKKRLFDKAAEQLVLISGHVETTPRRTSQSFDALSMDGCSPRIDLQILELACKCCFHQGAHVEALLWADALLCICDRHNLGQLARFYQLRGRILQAIAAPVNCIEFPCTLAMPCQIGMEGTPGNEGIFCSHFPSRYVQAVSTSSDGSVRSFVSEEQAILDCLENFDRSSELFLTVGDEYQALLCSFAKARVMLDHIFGACILLRIPLDAMVNLSPQRKIFLPEVEKLVTSCMTFAAKTSNLMLCLGCYLSMAEIRLLQGRQASAKAFWLECRDQLFTYFMDGTSIFLSRGAPPSFVHKVYDLLRRLSRCLMAFDRSFINSSLLVLDASFLAEIESDQACRRPMEEGPDACDMNVAEEPNTASGDPHHVKWGSSVAASSSGGPSTSSFHHTASSSGGPSSTGSSGHAPRRESRQSHVSFSPSAAAAASSGGGKPGHYSTRSHERRKQSLEARRSRSKSMGPFKRNYFTTFHGTGSSMASHRGSGPTERPASARTPRSASAGGHSSQRGSSSSSSSPHDSFGSWKNTRTRSRAPTWFSTIGSHSIQTTLRNSSHALVDSPTILERIAERCWSLIYSMWKLTAALSSGHMSDTLYQRRNQDLIRKMLNLMEHVRNMDGEPLTFLESPPLQSGGGGGGSFVPALDGRKDVNTNGISALFGQPQPPASQSSRAGGGTSSSGPTSPGGHQRVSSVSASFPRVHVEAHVLGKLVYIFQVLDLVIYYIPATGFKCCHRFGGRSDSRPEMNAMRKQGISREETLQELSITGASSFVELEPVQFLSSLVTQGRTEKRVEVGVENAQAMSRVFMEQIFLGPFQYPGVDERGAPCKLSSLLEETTSRGESRGFFARVFSSAKKFPDITGLQVPEMPLVLLCNKSMRFIPWELMFDALLTRAFSLMSVVQRTSAESTPSRRSTSNWRIPKFFSCYAGTCNSDGKGLAAEEQHRKETLVSSMLHALHHMNEVPSPNLSNTPFHTPLVKFGRSASSYRKKYKFVRLLDMTPFAESPLSVVSTLDSNMDSFSLPVFLFSWGDMLEISDVMISLSTYLPECVLVFLPESRTKEAVTFMMKAQDWYVKKGQLTGGTDGSPQQHAYRFLMLVLHKLCHEAFIPVVLMHPPSRL